MSEKPDPELEALLAQLDLSGPPAPPAPKKTQIFSPFAKKLSVAPPGGSNVAPAAPAGRAPTAGTSSSVGAAKTPAPPPPPPMPSSSKSPLPSSTAKVSPVASLFAKAPTPAATSATTPQAPPAPKVSPSSAPSTSTAPARSFQVVYDETVQHSGGGGKGHMLTLNIDGNTQYEDVCNQIFEKLPWYTSGVKYAGDLPAKPPSASQLYLRVNGWSCNRKAKVGELGLKPMSNGCSFYFGILPAPGRVVWASKGEMGGVQYMLESGLMTVDQLFMEVASCNYASNPLETLDALQYLIEKGADISNPTVIKQLISCDHGSAKWRQFPSVETWIVLFSNPKSQVVGIEHDGKNLIQFFASMELKWASKLCPILAGRGLNPESGSGTTAKLYCTRNGWYDVIDAMDAAYKRVAGTSSAAGSSGAAKSSASSTSSSGGSTNSGGGTDPKLVAIVRALVELAVQTHDDRYLRSLREACGAYGWRV